MKLLEIEPKEGRNLSMRKCACCEKIFFLYASHAKQKIVHCSKKCKYKYHATVISEFKPVRFKKLGRKRKICVNPICKKEFILDDNNYTATCCSRSCAFYTRKPKVFLQKLYRELYNYEKELQRSILVYSEEELNKLKLKIFTYKQAIDTDKAFVKFKKEVYNKHLKQVAVWENKKIKDEIKKDFIEEIKQAKTEEEYQEIIDETNESITKTEINRVIENEDKKRNQQRQVARGIWFLNT